MPVVGRFRTYGVPLSAHAQGYSDAVFGHALVKQLEALGKHTPAIAEYDPPGRLNGS